MELNFCAVSPLSTYEPSSCELSKMQMCVPKSSHISELTCLAYMCVHPLQRAVLLCPFLYSAIEYSSTVALCQAQDVRKRM